MESFSSSEHEVEYDSTTDCDSTTDGDDPIITLDSIDKSKRIKTSIRAGYTDWEAREAFRELVQNWRDAIIASFDLKERDFTVVREERRFGKNNASEEILFKVPDPRCEGVGKCLGYILFKARNGLGTIELTNRSATLEPSHLDIGMTSKKKATDQAGAWGEGLKLALIVLMRDPQNHAVKCRSGQFNWTFNFTTSGHLVAGLFRMSSGAIRKAEEKANRACRSKSLLPFAPMPGDDVQFVIGQPRKGRNSRGHEIRRKQVRREDFDAWCKSALFLHASTDDGVVATPHGDLLTGPRLTGSIYLKGLLLSETIGSQSASITDKPLKYGYNFAHGKTNRERQSVAGAKEEAQAILAIWRGVLEVRPEMVQDLSDLLNTEDPQYADVHNAKHNLVYDKFIATSLRDYLLGEQFRGTWYYCAEHKRKNPRLDELIQGLGCKGEELAEAYWTILHRHGLLRSAEAEEEKRFRAAQAASIPNTSFAGLLHRLLKYSMRACKRMDDINVTFVQAGQLQLQLHFSGEDRILLIHEQWLDAAKATDQLGVPEDMAEPDKVSHSVHRLFTDALDQLPQGAFSADDCSKSAKWRKNQDACLARQNLSNYFRTPISIAKVDAPEPALRLTWSFDSCISSTTRVMIQCHRKSTCSRFRARILAGGNAIPERPACTKGSSESVSSLQQPSCRVWHGSIQEESRTEIDLEEDAEYFFVFLRLDDPGAFPLVSDIERVPSRTAITSPGPSVASQFSRLTSPASPTPTPTPMPNASGSTSRSHRNGPESCIPAVNTNDNHYSDDERTPTPGPSQAANSRLVSLRSTNGDTPGSPDMLASSATKRAAAVNGEDLDLGGQASSEPTSIILGSRLHGLDSPNIDRARRYNGESSDGVRVIVGVIAGEPSLSEEMRKRPRRTEAE